MSMVMPLRASDVTREDSLHSAPGVQAFPNSHASVEEAVSSGVGIGSPRL